VKDLSEKDLSFNFGFTIQDIDELEEVKELVTDVAAARSQSIELEHSKLIALHQAILPLLNNLQTNAEKSYIYWPDRTAKIEEFKQVLQDIVDG